MLPDAIGIPFTNRVATPHVFAHKLEFVFLRTIILAIGPLTLWVSKQDAPDSPTPPVATLTHALETVDMFLSIPALM